MLYENSVTGPGARPAVATVAVVFALAGALLNLIGAIRLGLDFYSDPGRFDNSLATIAVLGGALLALTLTYGAVLIQRGDESGRYMVLVAAGAWAAIAVIGLLCALADYHSDYGVHWFAESGRIAEALFATCGIPGAVTAFIEGDWTANLAAMAAPVCIVLAATPRSAR